VRGQLLRDVGVFGRSLKDQMLQQVSHAGLAIVFMPGADEIRGVYGDVVFCWIGEQEDAETVALHPVLGDAFDRSDFFDSFGESRVLSEKRARESGREYWESPCKAHVKPREEGWDTM